MFFVFLLISSACSVQPKNITEYYDHIEVTLEKNSSKTMNLVAEDGEYISSAKPNGNTVRLNVPENIDHDQCFSIANHKGKPFSDFSSLQLTLPMEYKELSDQLKIVVAEITRAENRRDKNNEIASNKIQELNSNRAFNGYSCSTPAQRQLPARPNVACDSENECISEGAAICYSRFIGTEGCALAAREHNIAGILSSPSCSLIAANLAGEKYGLDSAIVDALHGVADDWTISLLKEESLMSKAFGLFVGSINYGVKISKAQQCTNNFVNHHYTPLEQWQNRVDYIRSEPLRIQSSCESLIDQHNSAKNIETKQSEIYKSESEELENLLAIRSTLIQKSNQVQTCG